MSVDPQWRRWIAENLMLGVDRTSLVDGLCAQGIVRDVAQAEVAAAAESPYLAGAERLLRRLAKRDWLLANMAKLEELGGATRVVPRLSTISPERFFSEFYYTNRPVILTGMIDSWPAMQLWSLNYFKERCSDPQVEMQGGRQSEPSYEIRSVAHKRQVRWSAILDVLSRDPTTNDFYITANNGSTNRKALAPLWDDIGPLPGILQPGVEQDGFFWLGPRGTITPWHHDLTNNLLVQIRGRKRVTLSSPTQTAKMRNFHHCYSGFGGDALLRDAPEGHRPTTLTCELGEGEILFIPIGWWHHVEGLSLSVSLSFINFVEDNDFASYYLAMGDL